MTPTPSSPKPTSSRRGLFLAPPRDTPCRCRGLSLAETIIVGLALTAVAVGLVVVGRSVQSVDAEGRTRSILARLASASRAYIEDFGEPAWASADAALKAMRRHPASSELLADVVLRVEPGEGLVVIDGYGRTLRFEPADGGATGAGQFVSAGRDGLFGDEAMLESDDDARDRAEADNHYGAELAPLMPMYPEDATDPDPRPAEPTTAP
ncbi:MAG: hypothetical protein AAGB29_13055 [Planctomycetota bacterium]